MADQQTEAASSSATTAAEQMQEQKIFELELQLAAANAEIKTANEAKNRAERQAGALRSTVSFLRQDSSAGGGAGRGNSSGINSSSGGGSGVTSGSPVRRRVDNASAAAAAAALTPTRKRKCVVGADEGEDNSDASNNDNHSAEITRLKSEIEELKRDATVMRRNLDDKAQEGVVAHEEAADMRRKLEAAHEDKASIAAEATDLMEKTQRLGKILKEKEQALKVDEKIISELRDKGRQSNKGLLKPKDDEIQSLKTSLAEAKNQSNSCLLKLKDDEIQSLKESVAEAKQTNVGLIKLKDNEIQSLKTSLAEAKNQSNSGLLKLKDDELQSLKKSVAEAKQSNAGLVKLKDDEIDGLKKSLAEAATKAEASAQAHDKLKKTEDALHRETRERNELQEEIRDLSTEISELTGNKERSFNFPRITADMNVATLKVEAKERGRRAGDANAMKKGELVEFLEVGTIHLSEVKRIMKVEKNPEAETVRLAAERRQQEEKAARQKEARERKAAEKKHNDALLTKKIPAHACLLGPTNSLMINGSTRSNMYVGGTLECDIGHCQNPKYLSPEKKKAPEWSCLKCNFDICTFCLDIAALTEEGKHKRLAAIEEEKSRALREKWAWTRDFPSSIIDPAVPAKPKRRFAVMTCRGSADNIQVSEYEWDGDVSKQFDSAFETLDDANLRTQFVFYCKNKYGESVETFGESRRIQKDIDEEGMIVLATGSDWGGNGWKVFVAHYAEYEERVKNQKKEIQRYRKEVERKEEQQRKKEEEERKKKEEKIESLRKVLDAPARIKNPPKSSRDCSKGKGFTVMKTSHRSKYGDSRSVGFDSSFKTKADANLRARYLCYVEDHPWGDDRLDADDLSDCASIPGVADKVVDGMVDIQHYNEDYGETHTFTVLPDDAYRFVDAAYDRNAQDQSLPKKKKLEKLPAKIRKPPAASMDSSKKKKYTVWTSCGYGNDGFHGYHGPPSKEFFASFDTLEDANKAAEYKFFAANPWGFDASDDDRYGDDYADTFGDFSRASKMSCVEYSVEPDDSECWTVAVAPSSAFPYLEDAVNSTSHTGNQNVTAGDYYGTCFN